MSAYNFGDCNSLRAVLCTATLMWAIAAAAADAPKDGAGNAVKPVVRVYYIRDLIRKPKNHTLDSTKAVPPTASQYFEQPAPAFSICGTERTPAQGAETIAKLVTEVVAPGTWSSEPVGEAGYTRIHDGLLIVVHLPEHQAAVKDFLDQLRAGTARTVTTIARWALLAPADAEKLAKPMKFAFGTVLTVDPAELDKAAGGAVKHCSRISALNGQTVHVASGRARSVVQNFRSNAGGGTGSVGYDPSVELVQDGLNLEITTTLSADGASASVEVHNVVSEWRDLQPARSLAAGTKSANAVAPVAPDRPDLSIQQLRTAAVVPVGKAVLIGGMTLSPQSAPASDGKQLYLVLEIATGVRN